MRPPRLVSIRIFGESCRGFGTQNQSAFPCGPESSFAFTQGLRRPFGAGSSADSDWAAREVQRSFVGSRSLCERLRCLRMTGRGANRVGLAVWNRIGFVVPCGAWVLFSALYPGLTPWAEFMLPLRGLDWRCCPVRSLEWRRVRRDLAFPSETGNTTVEAPDNLSCSL